MEVRGARVIGCVVWQRKNTVCLIDWDSLYHRNPVCHCTTGGGQSYGSYSDTQKHKWVTAEDQRRWIINSQHFDESEGWFRRGKKDMWSEPIRNCPCWLRTQLKQVKMTFGPGSSTESLWCCTAFAVTFWGSTVHSVSGHMFFVPIENECQFNM